MKISSIILLLAVYAAGMIGIKIMKKIQPEDKIYPVRVAFVCIVVTCIVICRVFWAQIH